MAEARTRSVRIRSRVAGVCAAGYVVALASFWLAGIAAYLAFGDGFEKILGFFYFPILLLPWVGEGTVGGQEIASPVWLYWFALQMILAIAAIWIYPYERRFRPRLLAAGPRALSRASKVADVTDDPDVIEVPDVTEVTDAAERHTARASVKRYGV